MRGIDKAVILILSRVFQSSTVIILSILLARSLSKTDYGTYVQISMIVQLFGVLLSFGIPSSLTYFLPKNIDKRQLILRSFWIMFCVGLFGLSLILLFKNNIAQFFNNPLLNMYMNYAGLGVLLLLGSLVYKPILLYKKETLLLAKLEIFRSIIFLGSMILCVILAPKVIYFIGIFIACFIIDFIFTIIIVVKEVIACKNGGTENSVTVQSQLQYSWPLGMTVLCWYSGKELDKYVISHYMKPEELAIYSRGAIEIPLVHLLANTISQIKQPDWVAQWDSGNISSLLAGWHSTIIKAALVIFPSFIFLELVSGHFISLLYSDKYSDSTGIFSLYLLILPLQITSYTAIVESTGKNKLVLIGYVAQITISVLISGFTIKYLGWYGPALVSVLGLYAWTIYVLIITANIFRIKFGEVFPWSRLAKILLISVCSGVIPLLLLILTSSYINTIILQKEMLHASIIFYQAVVFGSCFFLLAKKYSLLDTEDVDHICRWLLIDKIKEFFKK